MVQLLVTCENGHDNPESRLFCGDCGVPIVPTMAICVRGHVNLEGQLFCGDCGVPIRAPEGVVPGAQGGRWDVDPSGTHQYRYWDGDEWTGNVADSGTFSTDPFAKSATWHPETWVGIAAGVVTIVLVVAAIIGISSQLSRGSESPAAAPPPPSATTTAVAPESPVVPPPPLEPGIRAVAVIGATCRPNSSNSVTADGSTAYCEKLAAADTYMWSLYPGEIAAPVAGGANSPRQTTPDVAVCMAQTDRTAQQCVEYLQRPSDPGDGVPAA